MSEMPSPYEPRAMSKKVISLDKEPSVLDSTHSDKRIEITPEEAARMRQEMGIAEPVKAKSKEQPTWAEQSVKRVEAEQRAEDAKREQAIRERIANMRAPEPMPMVSSEEIEQARMEIAEEARQDMKNAPTQMINRADIPKPQPKKGFFQKWFGK